MSARAAAADLVVRLPIERFTLECGARLLVSQRRDAPVIALQMGLVLKPGSSEPWTPYRVFAAMTEAGTSRATPPIRV